jgi:hypothetical protein
MRRMDILITIEREPGASTVGAYSENPSITVVRDASVSDRDLLIAYADVLDDVQNPAAEDVLRA